MKTSLSSFVIFYLTAIICFLQTVAEHASPAILKEVLTDSSTLPATAVNSSTSHERSAEDHGGSSEEHHEGGNHTGFHVIGVNFERVSSPMIICAALLVSGLCKIFFHNIRKYVSKIPESCILICLGLMIGGVAYAVDPNNNLNEMLFNPDVFFLYILPPIVMEAGYFMPKEPFFANLGTILTYAIFGTIFNTVAIGGSLYGVYQAGLMPGMEELGGLTILDTCLYGSIISAVDPVAVISVFEEIHVNIVLYICVFGESLLNDGVAVVLFKMFENFLELGKNNIGAAEFGLAFCSFFVVALGGLFVGILYGYVGAFATKYTKDYHIIEPTLVFLFCYMAYLTAEVFHMSGIISIVFAGFTMSAYAQHNMSSHSQTTIHYGLKMLANVAETLIFILLGISAVSDFWRYWNNSFVIWTLLFITFYRPIGVITLTYFANKLRLDKINMVDQFVMAYGGLRGAIAFSLVSLTKQESVPAIRTMVCATIVVIYFTCFVQGSTIRPIVECLKVKTQEVHRKSMFEEINYRLIDHLMAGVEDIIGHHGHHYWHHKLITFHTEYISKHFIREPFSTQDQELLETFQNINKLEAENLVEELQKGTANASSAGNLPGQTFASLIMPKVTEGNSSFKMRENDDRNETYVDMKAAAKSSNQVVEDANIHHLLTENLYVPRRGVLSKYHRGILADDTASRRQEQEILLRRKIHNRRNKKKHHHHHHHRHHHHHNKSSSSRMQVAAADSGLMKNRDDSNELSMLLSPNTNEMENDQGITFQVTNETPPSTIKREKSTTSQSDGHLLHHNNRRRHNSNDNRKSNSSLLDVPKASTPAHRRKSSSAAANDMGGSTTPPSSGNETSTNNMELPWKLQQGESPQHDRHHFPPWNQPSTSTSPQHDNNGGNNDVAIDRELPWKRDIDKEAVYDPSLFTSNSIKNMEELVTHQKAEDLNQQIRSSQSASSNQNPPQNNSTSSNQGGSSSIAPSSGNHRRRHKKRGNSSESGGKSHKHHHNDTKV